VWHEATVLTLLASDHTLAVHNADVFGDVPYLDTALARYSLDRIVGPGLEPHVAVEAIRRTLRGLALCHSRRLLHRDVKPANIFEDFNGDVRLGDFGIAVLMDSGDSADHLGDARIRPPESYAGERFTVRSDIYGAAVSLYFLLAARWPFDQVMQADLDAAIRAGLCPPLRDLAPHVSKALGSVVAKGMAVDPVDRFTTASEFDSALGLLPVRQNRFTPISPAAGFEREWGVSGTKSLSATMTSAGAIEVRQASSARRVSSLSTDGTASSRLIRARRLFDRLR
jgi:serine/threonine protein kinase